MSDVPGKLDGFAKLAKDAFLEATTDGEDPWAAIAAAFFPKAPKVVVDFIAASRLLDIARSRIAVMEERLLTLSGQVTHQTARADQAEGKTRLAREQYANIEARLLKVQKALVFTDEELAAEEAGRSIPEVARAVLLEINRRAAGLL